MFDGYRIQVGVDVLSNVGCMPSSNDSVSPRSKTERHALDYGTVLPNDKMSRCIDSAGCKVLRYSLRRGTSSGAMIHNVRNLVALPIHRFVEVINLDSFVQPSICVK